MDIYLREGVKLEAPIDVTFVMLFTVVNVICKRLFKLQFEIIAYKKFRTEYRPHMLKLKVELCSILNRVEHPYFDLIWKLNIDGNFLQPCPISVRLKS